MDTTERTTSVGAVYDASVDQYLAFAGTELSEGTETPIDLATLDAFTQMIAVRGDGLVADLGCGPGRVASYLARRGAQTIGFDVSEQMIAAARNAHPHLDFHTARLDDLPLGDRALSGAVSWYSIIHTAPSALGRLFTEFRRVLQPGGLLLVAFQDGDGDPVHRRDAFGTGLDLTSYRHDIDEVTDQLLDTSFVRRVVTRREPELAHETTAQAFLIVERT